MSSGEFEMIEKTDDFKTEPVEVEGEKYLRKMQINLITM